LSKTDIRRTFKSFSDREKWIPGRKKIGDCYHPGNIERVAIKDSNGSSKKETVHFHVSEL